MLEMIKLFGVACAGYHFAEGAQPFQSLKRLCRVEKIPMLQDLLDCSLCFTFWLGLAVYQNIWYAFAASVIAEIISRWMKKNLSL
jgi:predicted small integral membrane protein